MHLKLSAALCCPSGFAVLLLLLPPDLASPMLCYLLLLPCACANRAVLSLIFISPFFRCIFTFFIIHELMGIVLKWHVMPRQHIWMQHLWWISSSLAIALFSSMIHPPPHHRPTTAALAIIYIPSSGKMLFKLLTLTNEITVSNSLMWLWRHRIEPQKES